MLTATFVNNGVVEVKQYKFQCSNFNPFLYFSTPYEDNEIKQAIFRMGIPGCNPFSTITEIVDKNEDPFDRHIRFIGEALSKFDHRTNYSYQPKKYYECKEKICSGQNRIFLKKYKNMHIRRFHKN